MPHAGLVLGGTRRVDVYLDHTNTTSTHDGANNARHPGKNASFTQARGKDADDEVRL